MDVSAPATTPPPARSLKLTVSFIAFLAVLPLLFFVASLNVGESKDKEEERLWHLSRTERAAQVYGWFNEAYKRALVEELATPRTPEQEGEAEKGLSDSLQSTFNETAKAQDLPDSALFWWAPQGGTSVAPVLLAANGTIDRAAGSEVIRAFETGARSESARSEGGGAVHKVRVDVIIPLSVAGRVLAVVRLDLPSEDWTAHGKTQSAALGTWFEECRGRVQSERAMRCPLPDPEPLRRILETDIEALRERLKINGLAVFLVRVPKDAGSLGLLVKSGAAPPQSSKYDEEAVNTKMPPQPEKDLGVATVIQPLMGNVSPGQSGVVAVAHFDVPPPPTPPAGRRFLLILTIAIMALVLGFLFFYMNQAISLPIQRLIGAMTRGTAGDLQPIAQGGAGEIAQLAAIYNRMAQENRKLLDQIRGFNEQLKTKVRLATGELERRNDELRRANERLFGLQRELSEQQRLASLGQLAGSMAHELGTPLNAMSGHIELLLAGGNSPEDVSKRLNLIGGQIERLSGIIQSNLQQLRAPAPRFVSVDLNALVQGIVSLVTPSVGAKRVAIRASLATDLPRVAGDPAQLEQVLMNLVNNALDAMPGGGSLDLLTAMKDGMACLQVRDSGAGIPQADLKKIFDPFYTTKSPGKGTGLGLAICSDIVKAHGGTIDVQSEGGKGSWFTVRLPVTEKLEGSAIRAAVDAPTQQQPSAMKGP